ncbi:hypothetical protein EI165_10340 [Pseudoalteromonas nigrifaciens]|uniref:hypothetical protein n=1 Tax=Pseudoalteromonas nigrifaciens TaxID=28109 RepID=UPI0017881B95|nr:hypothetical protein [Pseudoalteromonas nigrifaciens]MBE0420519.1 hypothetical protein [Pseudoalteromonas nigrifaciens]
MSNIDNPENKTDSVSNERKAELDKMAEEIAADENSEVKSVSTGNPQIDEILKATKENSERKPVDLNTTDAENNISDVNLDGVKSDKDSPSLDVPISDNSASTNNNEASEIVDQNDIPDYAKEQIPTDDYEAYAGIFPSESSQVPSNDIDNPIVDELITNKEDSVNESFEAVNGEPDVTDPEIIIDEDKQELDFETVNDELDVTDPEIIIDEDTAEQDFEAVNGEPDVTDPEIILDEDTAEQDFEAVNDEPAVTDPEIIIDEDTEEQDFEAVNDEPAVTDPEIILDENTAEQDDDINFDVEPDIGYSAQDNDFTEELAPTDTEINNTDGAADEEQTRSSSPTLGAAAGAAAAYGAFRNQDKQPPQMQQPTAQMQQPQGHMQAAVSNEKGFNFSFGSLRSLFRSKDDIKNSDINSSFSEFRGSSSLKDISRLNKLQNEQKNLITQAIELTDPASYDPANKDKVLNILDDINKASNIIESQSERLSASTANMPEHKKALEANQENFIESVNKLNDKLENNVNDLNDDSLKQAMKKIVKAIKDMLEKLFRRNNKASEMDMR